jgi:hypothetical protein
MVQRRVVVDHVVLVVSDLAASDRFDTQALAAGGTERAAPRVREEYSPRYDAAYVNDPDGNNIDAVHHG